VYWGNIIHSGEWTPGTDWSGNGNIEVAEQGTTESWDYVIQHNSVRLWLRVSWALVATATATAGANSRFGVNGEAIRLEGV
jgi:hypothetical protein